jgi:Mrp family chromosome partitioning ATPase
MAVSDPRIAAGLVDGVLLVTTGGRTRSNELSASVQEIERTGTPLLGVIVNRTDLEGESYYYYQSYYNAEPDPPSSSDGRPDASRPSRSSRRLPSILSRDSAGAEQGD